VAARTGVIAAALTFLSACSGDATPFEVAVEIENLQLLGISIVQPRGLLEELFISSGETVSFDVQGTTVQDSTIDLTSGNRRWSVDNPEYASVDDAGNLLGIRPGPVQLSVTVGNLVDNFALTVSDEPISGINSIVGESIVDRCLPQDYIAIAQHGANETRALREATWSVDSAELGSIVNRPNGAGEFTGINTGAATIAVTASGFSQTRDIEISDTLQAVRILPENISVEVGTIRQLAAVGIYLNGEDTNDQTITDSVAWELTEDNGFASISNAEITRGQLTGLVAGDTIVSASCGNIVMTRAVEVAESDDDEDSLSFQQDDPFVVQLSAGSAQLNVSTGSTYDSDNDVSNDDDTSWEFFGDGGVLSVSTTGFLTLLSTGNVIVRVTHTVNSVELTADLEVQVQ